MMPHLGEELWQALRPGRLLADEPWPRFDPALAAEDTVTVAVQVNGKLRHDQQFTSPVPVDAQASTRFSRGRDQGRGLVRCPPCRIKALDGKTPRKTIVVPNRIVNYVY